MAMNITFTKLPQNQTLNFEYQLYKTAIGNVLVVSWEKCLVAIVLAANQAKALTEVKRDFPLAKFTKKETRVQKMVFAYFKNPRNFTKALTLAVKGTSFQMLVWKALLQIPFGKTVTYSDIARKIRKPQATRAVASAIAANVFAILIPCHRVVPKNGGLGQYRWGTKNKKNILTSEKSKL